MPSVAVKLVFRLCFASLKTVVAVFASHRHFFLSFSPFFLLDFSSFSDFFLSDLMVALFLFFRVATGIREEGRKRE